MYCTLMCHLQTHIFNFRPSFKVRIYNNPPKRDSKETNIVLLGISRVIYFIPTKHRVCNKQFRVVLASPQRKTYATASNKTCLKVVKP